MLVFAVPAVPHDTVIGQRPGFVLLPTVHVHVIREPFFEPSPRASERPLAYTTAIVHRDAGATLTVTDALSPAVTDPAGVTTLTVAPAAPASASAARPQARARHVRTYPIFGHGRNGRNPQSRLRRCQQVRGDVRPSSSPCPHSHLGRR